MALPNPNLCLLWHCLFCATTFAAFCLSWHGKKRTFSAFSTARHCLLLPAAPLPARPQGRFPGHGRPDVLRRDEQGAQRIGPAHGLFDVRVGAREPVGVGQRRRPGVAHARRPYGQLGLDGRGARRKRRRRPITDAIASTTTDELSPSRPSQVIAASAAIPAAYSGRPYGWNDMDMLETGAFFLALSARFVSSRAPSPTRVSHCAPPPLPAHRARAPLQAATSSAPWPMAGSRT